MLMLYFSLFQLILLALLHITVCKVNDLPGDESGTSSKQKIQIFFSAWQLQYTKSAKALPLPSILPSGALNRKCFLTLFLTWFGVMIVRLAWLASFFHFVLAKRAKITMFTECNRDQTDTAF